MMTAPCASRSKRRKPPPTRGRDARGRRGGRSGHRRGDRRGANAPIGLHDPTAHAEIVALRAGGAKLGNYRLTGLTLVVTLEPCAMCAGAISHARIGRLVFGAEDPKGGAVVHGPRFFEQPTCHWRPAVEGGVLAEESAALLRGFFRARPRLDRPLGRRGGSGADSSTTAPTAAGP